MTYNVILQDLERAMWIRNEGNKLVNLAKFDSLEVKRRIDGGAIIIGANGPATTQLCAFESAEKADQCLAKWQARLNRTRV